MAFFAATWLAFIVLVSLSNALGEKDSSVKLTTGWRWIAFIFAAISAFVFVTTWLAAYGGAS